MTSLFSVFEALSVSTLLILLLAIAVALIFADDRGRYLKTVGTSISRTLNAIATGDPLETICARAGRWQEDGRLKGRVVGGILDFFFSRGHCRRSRARYLELFGND